MVGVLNVQRCKKSRTCFPNSFSFKFFVRNSGVSIFISLQFYLYNLSGSLSVKGKTICTVSPS